MLLRMIAFACIGLSAAAAETRSEFITAQADTSEIATTEGQTVYALGYLEPATRVRRLTAPSSLEGSRIEALLVTEGDRVEIDQVIAVLDNRDRLEAALMAAAAELTLAQAQLEQVEAGSSGFDIEAQAARVQQLEAQQLANISAQGAVVSRLSAIVEDALRNKLRFQGLLAEGAISVDDLEQRELAHQTAVDALEEAEAQLDRLERTRDPELAEARAVLARLEEVRVVDQTVARTAVTVAETRRQQAEAELEQAFVRAPLAAQVIEIHAYPGEQVQAAGIASLAETNHMQVVAEIHESDVGKIAVGDRITASSVALTSVLVGSIEFVGLQINRQSIVNSNPAATIDARVIEVRIGLEPESAALVAGLSNLQVDVVIEATRP